MKKQKLILSRRTKNDARSHGVTILHIFMAGATMKAAVKAVLSKNVSATPLRQLPHDMGLMECVKPS